MALTNMVKGPAVAGLFIWRPISSRNLSSPNFLYQYFLISLLVFQVLEVAYSDRDAA